MSWLFLFFVAIVIAVATVAKYRESERRAVVRALALAAQRGIPLSTVARDLGSDMTSRSGTRLLQFADALDEGMPLAESLAAPPRVLSRDDVLAAEFGQAHSIFAQSMTEAAGRIDLLRIQMRSILEKLFYLLIVALWASCMATYFMIEIVPTFAQLFESFDLDLPGITLVVIELSYNLVPAAVILTLLYFVVLCIGVGCYIGVVPRSFPILRWWSIRVDSANIKRMLALAVRQQQPIVETLRWLSERHPLSNVRLKLTKAVAEMEHGQHWCDCMCLVGLMPPADAAVLRAAEKVGNLPWALEEMADSTLRRMTYRITAVTNVLFPLCIVGLGCCVFVFAVSMLLPFFTIIELLA